MFRLPALALALAAAGCSPGGRAPSADASRQAMPDQVIAQFSMENFVQGGREWTLESPKAYVYEVENRVDVDRPRIRFYEKGRPGAVMDAGRGRFFTDSRDLRAWDGVVMVSTDGAKVESPWMEYRAQEDVIESTAPVTVTRQRSVLRGVGWRAKPDLSLVVVKNQVLEYSGPDIRKKK